MTDFASLGIKVDSTQVKAATNDLNNLAPAANRAESATTGMGKSMAHADNEAQKLGIGVKSVTGLVGGMAAAFSAISVAKDLVKTVEQVQNLELRLKGLTQGAQDYANVESYLSRVSQQHHKDNLVLAESLSRILTIEQTGIITRKTSAALLEGMSNAQSKTGATADDLKSSMVGLTQALGMGTVQWEEIKQVTEPIPGLMTKIAEAAGFTGQSAVGDFKALVAEGQVTSDMFGNIMVKALEQYQGAAEAAGSTLTAQYADVKNAWTDLAKELESPINDTLTPILTFVREQVAGLAQDLREIKALGNSFASIEANGMRPPGYVRPTKPEANSDSGVIAARTAEIAANKKLIAETEQWYSDIVIDEEKRRYKALDDAKKKAAADSASLAKQQMTDARNKAEAIAKGIQNEIDAINDQHNKLSLSERDYYAMTLAAKGLSESQRLMALSVWDSNKALEAQKASGDKATSEMDALIDKYNQLTLSAHDYYAAKLKADGISPEQSAPLLKQFDKNTAIEASQNSIDAAREELLSYNKALDDTTTKLTDLGGVTSSIFDGALGGVSAMAGAFDNLINSIDKSTQALALNSAEKRKIDAFQPSLDRDQYLKDLTAKQVALDKNAQQELKYNKEIVSAKLAGTRQIAGAVSDMLEKGTAEQKAAHAIEIGLAVAEVAMNMQKVLGIGLVTAAETASVAPAVAASTAKGTAKAAEAVATQATAGPYIGFALMAAMAAAMAAIGFGVGGGGDASVPPPTSPDTGTVLGDPTARSESIDKTYQLLQDIHASEYATLRSIDRGIYNLHSGITDVITRLFQAGGINVPSIDGTAKLGSGASIVQMGAMLGSGGLAKYDPIANFILGGIFGKVTQSVVGSGIGTNSASLKDIMAGNDLSGYQYATIETKKKSWFSSKTSYSEQRSALDSEIQDSLSGVFKSMGDTMFGLAVQLGHDTKSKVEQYIIPAMKIELHGLSGEKAAEKLNGIISAALDTMSESVFGEILGQYQQLGEGMLETTTRIVAEIGVVTDALAQSGVSISGDVIAVSDAIAQATGGLKNFQEAFENAFDKFASDGAKQKRLVTSLQGQLSELFPQSAIDTLAQSREEYVKLAASLDQTNPKYAEQYALLIKLSDGADQYYKSIEEGADKLYDLVQNFHAFARSIQSVRGSIGSNIVSLGGTSLTVGPEWQQQVIDRLYAQLAATTDNGEKISLINDINQAVMDRYDSELKMLDKVGETVNQINAYLDKLKLSDKSPLTNGQKLAEAQAQYSTQLAMANAGDKDALSGLTGYADAYLQQARIYYASSENYTGIFNSVTSALEALAVPKGMDETTYKAETLRLQDKSISELQTLDSTLQTIYTAEQALFASRHADMMTVLINIRDSFSSSVTTMQSWGEAQLGRSLTDFESQWITDQFRSGRDSQSIYAEAQQYIDGSHANGLDYVPFDGYRAELHKGERVLTAQQARAQDGENSQELITELRALRAEVAQLRSDQREHTGALIRSNFDANDKASDKIVTSTKDAKINADWAHKSKAVIV